MVNTRRLKWEGGYVYVLTYSRVKADVRDGGLLEIYLHIFKYIRNLLLIGLSNN